jgi:transcriptional regulator with XRE-family HTH domain
VEKQGGIPSNLIAEIINEWKRQYGPTFPLYGNNTVRHDISGSVRPLLSSTEIPHERILAESSGVSKKTISKIMSGDTKEVSFEVADKLVTAMNKNDVWYCELREYYL